MIVKNESKHIKNCILSIKQQVKEIIVVDHYSTDSTLSLAVELGAKVYERDWSNDFAEARNYAISHAEGSAIMIMDADEEFDSDVNSLRLAFERMHNRTGAAVRVGINNILNNGTSSLTWVTRMFPNCSEYQYVGRIHEQLHYKRNPPSSFDSNIMFNHYGYQTDEVSNKDKVNRNLNLLLLDLNEQPDNPYILFQIGRCHVHLLNWNMAKQYLKHACSLLSKPYPIFASSLLLELAKSLMKSNDWDELFEVIKLGLEIYPDYTDLYYMYGVALIESRNVQWFSQIPAAFEACLQLGDSDGRKFETVPGVGSYRANFNLGLYYEIIGKKEQAVMYYEKSLQQGYGEAQHRLRLLTNLK
ncbi:glycosyltransferase [Paenibacillus sp. UMB4589-SE434]|uniref:tetratricopeptide repeat-containing glycosyltransferase n=1 Tax=Paenibacillus sp. UMB4589-SE434 TaxID=3046314 RepID=UPI00255015A2|nr:glycosyltransferase [Paenibacillus sp. UMB4589-SE434]